MKDLCEPMERMVFSVGSLPCTIDNGHPFLIFDGEPPD